MNLSFRLRVKPSFLAWGRAQGQGQGQGHGHSSHAGARLQRAHEDWVQQGWQL